VDVGTVFRGKMWVVSLLWMLELCLEEKCGWLGYCGCWNCVYRNNSGWWGCCGRAKFY